MSTSFSAIEDEAGPGILSALPQIIWQRKWLIIIPALLALAAGITAAIVIPPKFQSSATILIESQQLPTDAVSGSVNEMIDQRIARARERVLSRKDLIRLIRENNLYPDEQKRLPLSEIVEEMRASTSISAVPIDIGGGVRSMLQGGTNAIALHISFDYSEAIKAQVVTQQYVNRFLEVDAQAQTENATTAASFLSEQQSQLANQINEIDAQIAKIKTENGSVLAVGSTYSGNASADAMRIDSQIAQIQADNARMNNAGGAGDPAVAQAEANLRMLQARFSATHPDVVAAKAQLDAARASGGGGGAGLNPVIAANRAQIAALQQAKGMLLSDSARSKAAATQAPLIAGQIEQLTKRGDILREQYRAIATRSQNADMNKRMETEQKGERLTLADPPVVPDQPYKPNRPVFIAGGLAAGIGLGLALTILFELLFHPIRGAEQLKIASGQSPIAIIPDFQRKPHFIIRYLEQRNRKRSERG